MISPHLEALLEPLESFEAVRRSVARLGDRLVDLSYLNPHQSRQEAKAAIREALDATRPLDLQYSPFGGQTLVRRAVADALRESHGLDFSFEDVILTPGAMAALQVALRGVGQPGDDVVIPIPCWLDYPLYASFAGLKATYVPLAGDSFELDAERIAAALTPKTCAVLFSQPANPTGRSYASETLAKVADVLSEAEPRLGCRPTLIADETHRDYIPRDRYTSACRFFDRTLLIYSFGKYHLLQGQRSAYVAVSPNHPDRARVGSELVRWTRITGLATPTALMQRTIPKLLQLHYDYAFFSEWQTRFFNDLSAAGFNVVRPDGTLFLYVETPNEYDDFGFVLALAQMGLLVLPAPVFHHSGYFRVCISGTDETLTKALDRLKVFAPA